jgi:uncharacterized protein (TIRG00374 family)
MLDIQTRHAAAAFWLVSLAYVGLLFWLDQGNGSFAQLDQLFMIMPILFGYALTALLVRGIRWKWLLARSGHSTGMTRGILAYFAGFAFTATPGKVGELVRIRYLKPMGVPAARVISAFVFERTLDLLVVLGIALLAAWHWDIFPVVAGFVLLVVFIVLWLIIHPQHFDRLILLLRSWRLNRLVRMIELVKEGVANSTIWLTPLDLLVSLVLGTAAWGLTAYTFVFLLGQLNISLPFLASLAIFPTAMLAGAASMLPGGLGSTEGAVIALLAGMGVSVSLAATAAVGIRLATLWFAMFLGLFAMTWLGYLRVIDRA